MDDDGEWAVRVVLFDPDGEAESFAPGALGELGDVRLAAVESMLVFVGLEDEAFEVAKVVEDEAGDFACECAMGFFRFGGSASDISGW